jgi:hypothetical protein
VGESRDHIDERIRRGRASLRKNRAKARDREELAPLDQVIEKANSDRQAQIQKNITAYLDPKKQGSKAPWETEKGGLAPEGEPLTLEDLIYLRPFTMEDMNSTVAFRVNDRVMRATQRVREASGGAYDIISDLYRDAYVIGLLVLGERHKSILGLEMVISRAEKHERTLEEAHDTVSRFKTAIRSKDPEMQKIYMRDYLEKLDQRPRWIQEAHLGEIRKDEFLSALLGTLESDE